MSIDDQELESPARAVKLVASDWRKLAALAIGGIIVLGGVTTALATAIVNTKLDAIATIEASDAAQTRRLDALEKDMNIAQRDFTDMKSDLKQAVSLLNRIAASLEARGYPVAKNEAKATPSNGS